MCLFFCLFIYVIRIVCYCVIFFFFQAEDGIRDYKVTGVQTCALPICEAAVVSGYQTVDPRLVLYCTAPASGCKGQESIKPLPFLVRLNAAGRKPTEL